VVRDILEQYAGQVIATTSPLGGARMEVIFQRQEVEHRRE
jgi:two-component system, OmpR family, sensor histidine kinase PhoQ